MNNTKQHYMSFVAIQRIPRHANDSTRHLNLIEHVNEQSANKCDLLGLLQIVNSSGFADGSCVWPAHSSSVQHGNGNIRLALDWFQSQLDRHHDGEDGVMLFVCNTSTGFYSYLAVSFNTVVNKCRQDEQWIVCWRLNELFSYADLIAIKCALSAYLQSQQPTTTDTMQGRDMITDKTERAAMRVVKRALDICDDGVLLCSADGSIIDGNLKVSEWFGESVRPLRVHTKAISWLANIIHPDNLGQVTMEWRDLQQTTTGEDQVDLDNIQMVLADGRTAEFKVTIAKVTHQYTIDNWIVYIRDAQKIARERRERLVEDSRAHFLAEMSHEIRTPLSCIIGTADLIKYTNLQREQLDLVSTISTCSRQLFQLIENILDFSKIHEQKLLLNPTASVLEKVIYEAVQLVSPEIHRKDLDFFLNIDARVPECVVVDALRLRQVLTNLIGNAVKFTNDHTMVSVCVTVDEEHLPVRPAPSACDTHPLVLRFEIEDRGPGLDEGENSTLFESYVQLNETIQSKFGGTGLGLAISKRLVTMMGGSVWFESGPTVDGCKFIFTVTTCAGDLEKCQTAVSESDDNLTMASATKTLRGYLSAFVSRRREKLQMSILTRSADLKRYVMSIFSAFPCLNCIDAFPNTTESSNTRYIITADDAMTVSSLKQMIDGRVIGVILLTRDEVKLMRALNEQGVAAKTVRRPIYTPLLLKTCFECLVEAQMAENVGISANGSVVLRRPTTPTSDHPPSSANNLHTDLAARHPLPNHILLVDDNQINIQLMSRILHKLGYQPPLTAETGLQAVDLYQQHCGRVSCIFMDMEMPEMSGIDATIAIRRFCDDQQVKTRPHIIALTANAFQEDEEACLRAGMCRYLSKPVRWSALEAELVLAWRVSCGGVSCRCTQM